MPGIHLDISINDLMQATSDYQKAQNERPMEAYITKAVAQTYGRNKSYNDRTNPLQTLPEWKKDFKVVNPGPSNLLGSQIPQSMLGTWKAKLDAEVHRLAEEARRREAVEKSEEMAWAREKAAKIAQQATPKPLEQFTLASTKPDIARTMLGGSPVGQVKMEPKSVQVILGRPFGLTGPGQGQTRPRPTTAPTPRSPIIYLRKKA